MTANRFLIGRSFPRTELKAERCIDAVRAMAAFGVRGYGREATAVIVELLKEYDNDKEAQDGFSRADKPRRSSESSRKRPGPSRLWVPVASTQVLAHLDRPAVLPIANQLYNLLSSGGQQSWARSACNQQRVDPELVRWTLEATKRHNNRQS